MQEQLKSGKNHFYLAILKQDSLMPQRKLTFFFEFFINVIFMNK